MHCCLLHTVSIKLCTIRLLSLYKLTTAKSGSWLQMLLSQQLEFVYLFQPSKQQVSVKQCHCWPVCSRRKYLIHSLLDNVETLYRYFWLPEDVPTQLYQSADSSFGATRHDFRICVKFLGNYFIMTWHLTKRYTIMGYKYTVLRCFIWVFKHVYWMASAWSGNLLLFPDS